MRRSASKEREVEVRRKLLGQLRIDHGRRVVRGCVLPRVLIESAPFFYDRVLIGDRDQDFDGSVRKGLRDRQLIEVQGIVVVNRAPQELSQVLDSRFIRRGRPMDRGQFGEGRPGEIGGESPLQHDPVSDPLQRQPLARGGGIRHGANSQVSDCPGAVKRTQADALAKNQSWLAKVRPFWVIYLTKPPDGRTHNDEGDRGAGGGLAGDGFAVPGQPSPHSAGNPRADPGDGPQARLPAEPLCRGVDAQPAPGQASDRPADSRGDLCLRPTRRMAEFPVGHAGGKC